MAMAMGVATERFFCTYLAVKPTTLCSTKSQTFARLPSVEVRIPISSLVALRARVSRALSTSTGRANGWVTTAALGIPAVEDDKGHVGSTGFQLLGNKEKKELRAYAHQLGKDINVQQVGKLGVSASVVNSISDALEANEIIKVKVLENCPDEMPAIVSQLEEETGGQTVGKIGRTLLLYRASLRKLAAAEKRTEVPKRRSRIAMSAGRDSVRKRRSGQ